MTSNNELPAGRAPVGRPMHHIELVPSAAPTLVLRYRRPPQLEEETEKGIGEVVEKGKVHESPTAFDHTSLVARKWTHDGARL